MDRRTRKCPKWHSTRSFNAQWVSPTHTVSMLCLVLVCILIYSGFPAFVDIIHENIRKLNSEYTNNSFFGHTPWFECNSVFMEWYKDGEKRTVNRREKPCITNKYTHSQNILSLCLIWHQWRDGWRDSAAFSFHMHCDLTKMLVMLFILALVRSFLVFACAFCVNVDLHMCRFVCSWCSVVDLAHIHGQHGQSKLCGM